MEMARYLISEAARQTGVEAHVLRFWEEELQLEIPRNDQGHRYYTEEHIAVFEQIKTMKLQGFQLKAIKDSLERHQEAAAEAAPTIQEEQKEGT
ncbi:MAG: MerR family transcriptional regulator, partial [Lachnospiraceae bacterium]|nr:MerR family transcriptional regulator [Lachnospiraceae bacterium]